MIDSRCDAGTIGQRSRWFIVTALSLTLALVLPAFMTSAQAQTSSQAPDQAAPEGAAAGAPTQLVPVNPILPDTGQEPDSAAPSQSSGATTGTASENNATVATEPAPGASDSAPVKQGIEIQGLEEVGIESLGPLNDSNGGLGANMWAGSDRRTVLNLLQRLPWDFRSPAERALARRLLLTRATPPAAKPDDREALAISLLALRVRLLSDLGEAQALNDLAQIVPQRDQSEAIARARVDSNFLASRGQVACQEVQNSFADYPQAPYWRRALIACQLAEGQQDAAQLSLTILQEQDPNPDKTFLRLVEGFYGTNVKLKDASSLTPLTLFMLSASGQPVPTKGWEQVSPAIIAALAQMSALDLEVRTLAAERSLASGLLPASVLTAAYEAYEFDAAALDSALTVSQGLEGPAARALFYQAAAAQSLPVVRAEILNAALKRATTDKHYAVMARALGAQLTEMTPGTEYYWFAGEAGRALFLIGRYEQAAQWFAVARLAMTRHPEAKTNALALWPFAMIIGDPTARRFSNLEAWQASNPAQTNHLRLLFDALGVAAEPAPSWADLAAQMPRLVAVQPILPDPAAADPSGDQSGGLDAALLLASQDAAAAGRRGEGVLVSLLLLGEAGPSGDQPLATWAALKALKQLNLEGPALALAIESAIAAGL